MLPAHGPRQSLEQLLPPGGESTEMQSLPSKALAGRGQLHEEEMFEPQASTSATRSGPNGEDEDPPQYRVYKRRFFGLFQLVLLNIVVSWDWLTFSAVSTTASDYFSVSESTINWLSTGFLFAFVVASPYVISKYSHPDNLLTMLNQSDSLGSE